ncbi:BON domain-containing protein [Acidobacteria bacterium AH-259-G07]|nr:BON domain-containing protein [Acidobacteria bacterium AH-259-G07]
MRSNIYKSILSFVIGWVLLSTVAFATTNLDSSLEGKIRRELATLSYYSMFDNLSFRLDGSKVTLSGEVWWPALKKSAQRVVGTVEGITSVENQIEVLPTSSYDDSLRLATARVLFSNPVLRKYLRPGVSFGLLPYRSDIHIIVKNGNVILEGVVLRKTDSDVAFVVANGVSGVFSVTNNLRVKNTKKES